MAGRGGARGLRVRTRRGAPAIPARASSTGSPTRGASALDAARGRLRARARRARITFADLASDVRTALRSRRYFDKVLWPRLTALTPRPLPRPAARPGRGPSLASLRRVIAAIEKQP